MSGVACSCSSNLYALSHCTVFAIGRVYPCAFFRSSPSCPWLLHGLWQRVIVASLRSLATGEVPILSDPVRGSCASACAPVCSCGPVRCCDHARSACDAELYDGSMFVGLAGRRTPLPGRAGRSSFTLCTLQESDLVLDLVCTSVI